MWLERFIIIVVSLSRDFVNSSWGMYYPTKWDWMTMRTPQLAARFGWTDQ